MNEKELYIKADIFHIKLITESDLIRQYILDNISEFERLTINFELEEKSDKVDTILQYKNKENYNFICTESGYVFECPWQEINNSTIFPMIFRLLVEVMRQSINEIKVHASAITKGKYSSLFFAPSEGGKTTTAMAMCQKYQCLLKANDAAVVKFINEKPVLLRGDNIFKVRANSLKKYSQEIFEKNMNTDTDTPWLDKAKIKPEDIGVKTNNETSEIKYVFFIKLDTMIDGCTVKKYDKCNIMETDDWFKPKMQIYQNISGTIKGSDLIPVGNNGKILPIYLPSLDNNILSAERISFINNLFDRCEVYQLRGQLDEMTNIIKKIISEE